MPVKKVLKQKTAVISVPNKILNDKDKIVNGLTKKGNLVRKSAIIKGNDGSDIKILKKGIVENINSSSKKIIKQKTAIISVPNKMLNDKDKIVNGLTKKGNLVRKSVIIESNDGSNIKILKKGKKEGSSSGSSSPPKEKKVKVVKEKKVKEPKVSSLTEEDPSKFKPYEDYDINNYVVEFPDNMKTYYYRNEFGDLKIRTIKRIEKRYYPYVKPEGFINFDEINELYNKYDLIVGANKIPMKGSNLGTFFSTLIPFSLLKYYFNKKYKFITDEELSTLKQIRNNNVDIVPVVIENLNSNIQIDTKEGYGPFYYNCLVIPTTPKAKRIWLDNIPSFKLNEIFERGFIMIFELNTNKIFAGNIIEFYIGKYMNKQLKKDPNYLDKARELLRNVGL